MRSTGHLQTVNYDTIRYEIPVAPPGGKGGKLPPYGWTSKNYVICVCFHCHGTSSYHTTNTLHDRRAKSHVDTQTIQPGLGDFVLQTPYRPIPHFHPVTKSWRRHCEMLKLRQQVPVAGARVSKIMDSGMNLTIRYDTRCYFNVRSKADISQLNLPHENDN